MTSLIRAELRKLATIRSFRALAVATFVLIAGATWAMAEWTKFNGTASPGRGVLAIAGLAQTLALICGALAVTTEYRHKTITAAVLITPGRTPVLMAKLVALTVAGLVFGLLATAAAAAIGMPVLAGRHIASGVTGIQLAQIIAGGTVATALFAAAGVGLGAIIRNQVGAIVAVLALLYIAEPLLGLLPGAGSAVQRYGLAGLASGATGTTGYPAATHLLGQGAAAVVLLGYAALVIAGGGTLLRRRDLAS